MARSFPPDRRAALRRRRHRQPWPPQRHPGHERRLPAPDSDAGAGRTDMDLTGMTTMAKIGIICGTESGRTGLVAKRVGFPILRFRLSTIIFINPTAFGQKRSV